jgi:hypothetical protein
MSTTARVKVTLDISAGSAWADTVTMDQIVRQASEETVRKLENLIQKDMSFTIVGKPIVTAVFTIPESQYVK